MSVLAGRLVQNFTQRRSCASEHLRQRNTSEQIDQVQLIFEGATILRIVYNTCTETQLFLRLLLTSNKRYNSFALYFEQRY